MAFKGRDIDSENLLTQRPLRRIYSSTKPTELIFLSWISQVWNNLFKNSFLHIAFVDIKGIASYFTKVTIRQAARTSSLWIVPQPAMSVCAMKKRFLICRVILNHLSIVKDRWYLGTTSRKALAPCRMNERPVWQGEWRHMAIQRDTWMSLHVLDESEGTRSNDSPSHVTQHFSLCNVTLHLSS